jgi:hypothetical protein
LKGAVAALGRALEFDPDYAPAIFSLGTVEYQRGKHAEGRRLFHVSNADGLAPRAANALEPSAPMWSSAPAGERATLARGIDTAEVQGPQPGDTHMSIEELKAEALRLDPEARAYLARVLLASLDAMSSVEIEKLWTDEAVGRDEELESGVVRAYPGDEVLARARARRG